MAWTTSWYTIAVTCAAVSALRLVSLRNGGRPEYCGTDPRARRRPQLPGSWIASGVARLAALLVWRGGQASYKITDVTRDGRLRFTACGTVQRDCCASCVSFAPLHSMHASRSKFARSAHVLQVPTPLIWAPAGDLLGVQRCGWFSRGDRDAGCRVSQGPKGVCLTNPIILNETIH
jgi:hypothetical protein